MNLLRKLGFLILPVLLIVACEKDEPVNDPINLKASAAKSEEVKMIPFKGNFVSFPVAPDLTECLDPVTGAYIQAAVFNNIKGNATHIGVLDSEQSPLTPVDCLLDITNGKLTVGLDMTFVNKKGDGIRVLGESVINLDGSATGSFEVIQGFGKFEGATGWMDTVGFFDFETGVADYRGEGMVTQPNRN